MYCLDTNIIIALFRGDKKVKDKLTLAQNLNEEICTTTINLCELYKGVYLSNQPEKNLELIKEFLASIKILNLSERSSHIFGKEYSKLKTNGKLISETDLMIACIVKAENKTLITRNTKHFKEITDFSVEEW